MRSFNPSINRRPAPVRFKRWSVLLIALVFAGVPVFAAEPSSTPSEDPRRVVRQAERLVRSGQFRDAEDLLRDAAVVHPEESSIRLMLAHALLKQRRIVEAYDISFEIAEAEPNNSRALAVLGSSLLAAGRFPEARQVFFASIQLNRREAMAWSGFGLLEFYENSIDESLRNMREAVFHDPNNPDYIFSLAQISARAEQYKEAAEAYNRFLSVSRDSDDERRARIRALVSFLRYLGSRRGLYVPRGPDTVTVPFKLIGNRPIIEVRVNRHREPLRFVLDTGSGISVISDETAERLRVRPISRGGHARAVGGDGRFEIVYGFLERVGIGDLTMNNVPVYIREFHGESAVKIDGYIGLALISKFLATVDYGDLTFTLTNKNSRMADEVRFENGVPLRLTSSGFLSGEVQLEGVENPLNFIVDTGASISVISGEVASLDSVSQFIRDQRMRVIGAAGITDNVPSYLLPSISVGRHSRPSITAIALDLGTINEAAGFEQAGILGGNFLRNYRMTFDFKNSKVAFVPIGSDR